MFAKGISPSSRFFARVSVPGKKLVLFFLFLLVVGEAVGQVDTGSIVGTVTDTQHQAIQSATISLLDTGKSITRTLSSGSDGTFTISPLAIGTYTLTIDAPGFGRYTRTNINVTVQETVRAEVILKPGAVTQAVEVTSGTPLLETETSSIQQLVDQNRILNLPLNGRNVAFLAQTAPGVTIAQQDSRGLAASGSFSANGSRRGQNDYLLDGIDNNAAIADYVNQSQYVIMPPPDAVDEFVVQTSDYSAEFGHSAGAVLNATTRSGTDHFHGTFWEFLRNDALDARNYFATSPQKPVFHENQFGGSIGGPVDIPKLYSGIGKTYFFFDYQGTRISQNSSTVTTVPTLAERTSNFTDLSDLITGQSGTYTDALGRVFPAGTVFDPATTRATTTGAVDAVTGLTASSSSYVRDPFYAGSLAGLKNFTSLPTNQLNQLPANRLNPSAIALLNLYPSNPTAGIANNYTAYPKVLNNSDGVDLRIDQHFSNRDSGFARYSYLDTDQSNPGPFAGVADGATSRPGSGWTQAQNVAVSETHIFTPSTVNEARFGYSRVVDLRLQRYANDTNNIPGQYGIGGIPQAPDNGGLPTLSLGSLSTLGAPGTTPSNKASDILQVSDNLTFSHHKHLLRAGFLFQNIGYPTVTPSASRGSFGFSGLYTSVFGKTDGSTGRAQLLLNPIASTVAKGVNNVGGADTLSASSIPPISNLRRTYFGAYLQDDWRVTTNLVLNAGLRWEYFGVPSERNNRQNNFIFGSQGPQFLVPSSQTSQIPEAFAVLLASNNIALTPTDNDNLGVAQKLNFAPRFGFSYQARPQIVVRGGYGIFFGGYENYGINGMPAANFPYNIAASFTAANAATPLTPDNSIGSLGAGLTNVPLTASSAQLTNISLLGRQYDWKSAYTQSFNLQVQYQLSKNTIAKIGYVGSLTRHLQTNIGSNAVSQILPPTANAQQASFFPSFARGGTYMVSTGSSNYNGLQIDVTRRLDNNLSLEGNYSYSKCYSDARDLLDNTVGGYRAPYVPGAGIGIDNALCDIDVRNIVHANGTYVLPFGRNQRFLTSGLPAFLVGGWSAQALATVQDGQPFTVTCSQTTTAGLGCNALKIPGQNAYSGPHNAKQFLNPAAFANPAATSGIGLLGGGPTQVSGPAYRRLDLSIFRTFSLPKETRFEFRAEGFNITNTPNFSEPGSLNFSSPTTFASITSTRDYSRQIQFAGKFYW